MAIADHIQSLDYQLRKREVVPKVDQSEIGHADPSRLSSLLASMPQYNPDELVRRKGGIKKFDEMRVDDQIRAVLNLKKFARLATGWDIQSPGEEGEDDDIKRFVDFVFERIQGTFADCLIEIMTALDYGFSVVEIIWDVIEGGEWDGLIGVKSLKARRPHEIDFRQDVHGNILEIIQQQTTEGDIKIPIEKVILWTYDGEFDNPYGRSDMRSIYKNWFSKDIIIRFWNILIERHAEPMIHGTHALGATATDIDKVSASLKNFSARKHILTPDNFAFTIHEAELRGATAMKDALQYHDLAIARGMLVPKQLGLTEGGETGTFAQSSIHFRIFISILDALGAQIADAVSEQLIRPLVAFNFEVEDIPKFIWREMTDEIRSDIANVWITAVDKGVVAPSLEDENRFRELVRFPTREAREELIKETEELVIEGEVEELKALTNGHVHDHKLTRAKTSYEKRVDFKAIEGGLDERQGKAVESLAAIMTQQKDTIIKRIKKASSNGGLGFKDVKGIELPLKSQLRPEFVKFLKDVLAFGNRTAFNDIKGTRTAQAIDLTPFLTASEAVAFFSAKGDFFITGVEDALLAKIKPVLLDGIKSGASVAELSRRIDRVFAEWTGSAVEGLSAARLENVIRTSFTESLNEGRKMAFNDPDVVADIAGVQFSAILDERTTDVCDQLDGMIFRNDDPDLGRYTPPMHFQALAADTLIETEDGPIEIQNIKAGQRVLTDSGRYMPVYAVMSRDDLNEINILRTDTGRILKATDEHPILTARGWIKSKDLHYGDVLYEHRSSVELHPRICLRDPDDFPRHELEQETEKYSLHDFYVPFEEIEILNMPPGHLRLGHASASRALASSLYQEEPNIRPIYELDHDDCREIIYGDERLITQLTIKEHNSRSWRGSAIIGMEKEPLSDPVWNLAVEEDESYVAAGLIVHNCRSILVPILIDDVPKDGLNFITAGQKGRAQDAAQVGFGGEAVAPRPTTPTGPIRAESLQDALGKIKPTIDPGDVTKKQREALLSYAGEDYRFINTYYRDGEKKFLNRFGKSPAGQARGTSVMQGKVLPTANGLDEIMAKSIVQDDTVLYRGVKNWKEVFRGKSLDDLVGKTAIDKGFGSYTAVEEQVQGFLIGGTGNEAVIEMAGTKGLRGINMMTTIPDSGFVREAEILLNRGIGFKVVSVDPSGAVDSVGKRIAKIVVRAVQ